MAGAEPELLPQLLNTAVEGSVEQIRAVIESLRESAQLDVEQVLRKVALFPFYHVVLCGEFSRGKSTVINALLGLEGESALKTSVVVCTAEVTVLSAARAGELPSSAVVDGVRETKVANQTLKQLGLRVVDTPGCNSEDDAHQAATDRFLPIADTVVLVLAVTQVMSRTERELLGRLKRMGKNVIVFLNKVDLLTDPSDQQIVSKRVAQGLEECGFGGAPVILGSACTSGDPGVKELRSHLLNRMGSAQRVQTKLDALCSSLRSVLDAERAALGEVEGRLVRPAAAAAAANAADVEAAKRVMQGLGADAQAAVLAQLLEARRAGRRFLSAQPLWERCVSILRPAATADGLAAAEGQPAAGVLASYPKGGGQTAEASLAEVYDQQRTRVLALPCLSELGGPGIAPPPRPPQGPPDAAEVISRAAAEVNERRAMFNRDVARGALSDRGIFYGGIAATAAAGAATAAGAVGPFLIPGLPAAAVPAMAAGAALHLSGATARAHDRDTDALAQLWQDRSGQLWADMTEQRLQAQAQAFAPFRRTVEQRSTAVKRRREAMDEAEERVKRQRQEAGERLERARREAEAQ
eukprot:TRINITY_DN26002_c0_g1_i2.p1 TRINITY_DN26002_c0_g1~~TRINITY_DN26002_c0_g1_i2.p1  ORF type:complete len:617 (+),score=242.03 TRINITY_DN26002_c0_g1_i2:108-1853(+)